LGSSILALVVGSGGPGPSSLTRHAPVESVTLSRQLIGG
jgi:hypothetical protein